MRTVTVWNLRLIKDRTGLNPWSASTRSVIDALTESFVVSVPDEDVWRLNYLCSLISQRRMAKVAFQPDEEKRLTELINSLVMN